jgi:hydrogenase maturation protease
VTVADKRILILGIGNLLWADEGFGVRCVEAMAARWAFPESVTLLDGGTQGLYLLPYLEEADAVIVFDAIDYGLVPGTMKLVRGEDVPAFMGAKKMSLHQTGFQDVIATAELKGYRPAEMLLIGVQPEALEDYGGGLRPPVAAQIGPAIEVALTELSRRYRIHPVARTDGGEALSAAAVTRAAYESGRPSEAEACRIGDARFINLIAGAR